MEASLNIDTSCLHSYILNSGVKKKVQFSCSDLPVSPIYTLPHSHEIL